LVGMLFLIMCSFTLTNVFSILWTHSSWLVSTVLPAVIVELTNEERSESNLGQLRRNSVLDSAAQMKAAHMAKNEYFAHYSPDGVSPWHWFGEANYNFVHAGENLAVHFSESDAVVDAWMDSPTHRANILGGNYTEIGVGTAQGTYEGFKTVYVVQLFGTPAEPKQVVATAQPTPSVAGDEASVPEEVLVTEKEQVAAESVSITEIVETEPAPTQLLPDQTRTEDQVPAVLNDETVSPLEPAPIALMEVTDEGPILYSDFISTSTGGVPATIETATQDAQKTASYYEIVTQPHRILQIIYITVGLCVFLSLMISIFVEVRRQHPVQIAYGVGLLCLMGGLFYIHTVLSGGALIV
jgi:hypothetical protein